MLKTICLDTVLPLVVCASALCCREPASTPEESATGACRGAVYVRVHNASDFDFDSLEVGGVSFGALKRGETSEYLPALDCHSFMALEAISGRDRFSTVPIDQLPTTILAPGMYTREITAIAGEYSSGRLFSKTTSP